VTLHRGEFVESDIAPLVMATVHPSSLLRAPDDETRRREIAAFTADLQRMRERLDG
jgi:DNA polymerase